VIFITLMEICCWFLGAIGPTWGIHLYKTPYFHDIIPFDGDLWLGKSHFSLVG
jgi:hypothetical protein